MGLFQCHHLQMICERAYILQWWALMMKCFSQTCSITEALVSAALEHQVLEQEESISVWNQIPLLCQGLDHFLLKLAESLLLTSVASG